MRKPNAADTLRGQIQAKDAIILGTESRGQLSFPLFSQPKGTQADRFFKKGERRIAPWKVLTIWCDPNSPRVRKPLV